MKYLLIISSLIFLVACNEDDTPKEIKITVTTEDNEDDFFKSFKESLKAEREENKEYFDRVRKEALDYYEKTRQEDDPDYKLKNKTELLNK